MPERRGITRLEAPDADLARLGPMEAVLPAAQRATGAGPFGTDRPPWWEADGGSPGSWPGWRHVS
ncbi:hypothetical protein [Streptomyces sp. NPDC007984]|uniref:hypothetical protein n=1 Tax=Streptomyces sp. NPDC007984 TaxID=3364801 RepID=UPI0036EE79A0